MNRFTALTAAFVLGAVSMTVGGCTVTRKPGGRIAGELAETQQALSELREETVGLRATIRAQQKQIRVLQKLGDKRMERLFHVRRITLGRYTGGVDLEGVEGDDAIKVYLRPIDQDGSTIKAVGDVTIQLFDLAAQPEKNLIARYDFKAEEISKQWSGGFMSYHFSFECPWGASPPAHDEITARVEFTDYLTGKTFTAQKLCKVKLPSSAGSAETRPVK